MHECTNFQGHYGYNWPNIHAWIEGEKLSKGWTTPMHECMNFQGHEDTNWPNIHARIEGKKLSKGSIFMIALWCMQIFCIQNRQKKRNYYWLRTPPFINVRITRVTGDTNWPNIHVWIEHFSARGPRKNWGLQHFSLRSGVWGSHLDSPRKSFSLWSE